MGLLVALLVVAGALWLIVLAGALLLGDAAKQADRSFERVLASRARARPRPKEVASVDR